MEKSSLLRSATFIAFALQMVVSAGCSRNDALQHADEPSPQEKESAAIEGETEDEFSLSEPADGLRCKREGARWGSKVCTGGAWKSAGIVPAQPYEGLRCKKEGAIFGDFVCRSQRWTRSQQQSQASAALPPSLPGNFVQPANPASQSGECWLKITHCPQHREWQGEFADDWGRVNAGSWNSQAQCLSRGPSIVSSCGAGAVATAEFRVVPNANQAAVTSSVQARQFTRLKEAAQAVGLTLGTAASVAPWNVRLGREETDRELSNSQFVGVLNQHFNMLTSGQNFLNNMIWEKPADLANASSYGYSPKASEFVAKAAGLSVRGAHMFWHAALAPWMTDENLSGTKGLVFMKNHARMLAQKYPAIRIWNVVNEAIDGDRLRESVWSRQLGQNWVALAFQAAREAGAGKLFYNDYGTDFPDDAKTKAVLQLVSSLKQQGLIDGIGFQSHISAERIPSIEELVRNYRQFASLGLEIHITELDVMRCMDEDCRRSKAPRIVYNVTVACRQVPACKSISLWGLNHSSSWLHPRNIAPEMNAEQSNFPLLLNDSYQPEPAYAEMLRALNSTF